MQRSRSSYSRVLLFPAQLAFKLYDTYGFPLDLTQDVLSAYDIPVDVEGFERLMDQQREKGRAARGTNLPQILIKGAPSEFVGYRSYETDSEVTGGGPDASNPGSVILYTEETPFYPEGGGPMGSSEESLGVGNWSAFRSRQCPVPVTHGSIAHMRWRFLKGDLRDLLGRRVHLKVDRERRDASMRNHSATHILHYAAATRCSATRCIRRARWSIRIGCRFDFHHQGAISEGDLQTIEEEINARVRENATVRFDEMAYDDAIKAGALAFFGDKYGDVVRVIRMGDFSVELCGGTHVNATGQIGMFKLEAESGIAAGVRRIEALTGTGALEAIRKREKILEDIGHYLGARDAQALDRLEKLVNREKELEKKLRALEQKLASGEAGGGGSGENVVVANGVKVVTLKVEGIEPRSLREIVDKLRQKHGSCVAVVGSDLGDKVALVVAVTPDWRRS